MKILFYEENMANYSMQNDKPPRLFWTKQWHPTHSDKILADSSSKKPPKIPQNLFGWLAQSVQNGILKKNTCIECL